jgi:hypothetical protein
MAQDLDNLRSTLTQLDEAGAALSTSDDAPILVGGAGWRCGSTLLQRIIMSDPRVLIWGEPMEDRAFTGRLAQALSKPGQVMPFWAGDRPLENLQQSWTTLLWPDAADMKAGFRAMFDTWLGAPARRKGFEQWGLKEVRWDGADILFLRWLYPRARVFLIVRDPVDCYSSLLKYFYTEEQGYYGRWPDQRVYDAESYARYWSELVLSWIRLRQWENYQLIHYEDLVAGRVDLRAVGRATGLTLDGTVALATRVNGAAADIGSSAADLQEVRRIAGLKGADATSAMVSSASAGKSAPSQADRDAILKITEDARAQAAAFRL